MSNKVLKNVRTNPITGEPDYFFPMEITASADKEYARLNGLEVGRAMLGYRTFEAIMIPCKRKTHDAQGRDVYLDTPSEEQHRIYKTYSQDELDRQEDERMDGRCLLPSASGKNVKRCPRRIPIPAYVLGGNQPKTIANKCEGCPFERFKQAPTPLLNFRVSTMKATTGRWNHTRFLLPEAITLETGTRSLLKNLWPSSRPASPDWHRWPRNWYRSTI